MTGASRATAPLDTLKQTVLDSVEEFSRGDSQSDEMTFLIARYRTPAKAESPTA
jgi:serine phosphatase RsbU (regulator of sigma subunit)